jgi:tetrapyrrole methylase family protein/MazG family protein
MGWMVSMRSIVEMESFNKLRETVRHLRAEDGCPWDREQSHESLKPEVIEEAAEVICGINVYEQTGNYENLKEELGDLLLQIVMHAQIAEEEGIFTLDDVISGITEKMVRRHPHVFGNKKVSGSEEVLVNWEEIKRKEKEGKEDVGLFLPQAFDEAEDLIKRARTRKGY